jgi:hypothetical protein
MIVLLIALDMLMGMVLLARTRGPRSANISLIGWRGVSTPNGQRAS